MFKEQKGVLLLFFCFLFLSLFDKNFRQTLLNLKICFAMTRDSANQIKCLPGAGFVVLGRTRLDLYLNFSLLFA